MALMMSVSWACADEEGEKLRPSKCTGPILIRIVMASDGLTGQAGKRSLRALGGQIARLR